MVKSVSCMTSWDETVLAVFLLTSTSVQVERPWNILSH